MKPIKIKDYIKKSFIKYTLIILLLIFGVYILSLYLIFNHTIVHPNKEVHNELTEKIKADYDFIRDDLHRLATNHSLKQLLRYEVGHSKINQSLYAIQNELEISTNFLLLNQQKELVSSSLFKDEKEAIINNSYFRSLLDKLDTEEYMEQSIGSLPFNGSPFSTYFFSVVINDYDEVLGYLFFFLKDFKVNTKHNEMIYITDEFDNVIYHTNQFNIDQLGKFSINTNQNILNIKENYFYINQSKIENQLISVYTLTSINVFILLIVYGLISMALIMLVILLLSFIITPKILNKSMMPFDSLVSIIANDHKAQSLQKSDFGEFQIIYEEYNNKIKEIQELIHANKEISDKKKEMEIKHLEAKFNPHFLYNVLEMLKYEITLNPENASKIVVKIAKLMRYNTNFGNAIVPLQTDLDYLNDYIDLQQMRFGKRLNCHIKIKEHFLNIQVPKLIIQPLVENAIKHNIDEVHVLTIIISFQLTDDNIIFLAPK